jgi:hypothetical protein
MPLTLNDLKREIARFEEENGLAPDLYDLELTIDGQRLTDLRLNWRQVGSADYINLAFHLY